MCFTKFKPACLCVVYELQTFFYLINNSNRYYFRQNAKA